MILCVDPDATALEATREALEDTGFETRGAESLADVRSILDGDLDTECLVTEYELPEGTGLELVREVRNATPDAACILFTTVPFDEIETASFEDVIAEYLRKDDPNARDELVDLVRHSLSFRSQAAYPIPQNEDARLAALERYTTDAEALDRSLDRLTELATEVFDVDSAAVGLIDAHQEQFLACYGKSFDPLDREETVCTYTILEDSALVVEDVQDDARFSENEELEAADIQFYAGVPLVTPEGQSIGTFCLHNDEPRTFPERDRERLTLFADETMDTLVLHRRLREAQGGQSDE